MHKPHSSLGKTPSQNPLASAKSRKGFSIIEVTLAITIIATAFIALLGLLPAGLQIFRTTVDATNTMRITMHATAMLQAMEFSRISDTSTNYTIYFYDADGGFLDSDKEPVPAYEQGRVYAARLVIDQQNVTVVAEEYYDKTNSAVKALVVVGKNTPPSLDFLKGLKTSADVAAMPANARYKVLPILIAKTDGILPK